MNRNLQQNYSLTAPLRKTVHGAWKIAGLSAGFLVGVALAALPAVQFMDSPMWGVAGLTAAALACSKPRRAFVVLAIGAGLLLGLWHGSREQAALSIYKPAYGQQVRLDGRVNEDVGHGKAGEVRAQLSSVSLNGRPMHGKVWVSFKVAKNQSIKRSDTIALTGKLREGFGNFPASMSNATLTGYVQTSSSDKALIARDWFAEGIREAIPEPAASLGSGFLTGQHSDLPGNLSEELKVVGLTHAVVASGSNLTILVGFTRRLFGKASKFVATMGGALMTFGFVLITGFSPSMTRAGLVTGLSLAAWYYGRRIHPMVLLPMAAAITVTINPTFIWGDIGWYLSFSAFAGVLILAPLLQSYFWGKDYKPNIMMEILIGTSAAQIATMPVILFAFGTMSNYALLANMLVLPLIPLAMLLTFFAGITGVALGTGLAAIAGWPGSIVMEYMLHVIHWVATMPGAQAEVAYGSLALIGSYCAIIAASIYMWRKTSHSFGYEMALLIGERR